MDPCVVLAADHAQYPTARVIEAADASGELEWTGHAALTGYFFHHRRQFKRKNRMHNSARARGGRSLQSFSRFI
jgi:hypothetical protein